MNEVDNVKFLKIHLMYNIMLVSGVLGSDLIFACYDHHDKSSPIQVIILLTISLMLYIISS